MYKLEYSLAFEKSLKKLSAGEQKTVAGKLKILIETPFHPSLRTKKVQRLKDVFFRFLWNRVSYSGAAGAALCFSDQSLFDFP